MQLPNTVAFIEMMIDEALITIKDPVLLIHKDAIAQKKAQQQQDNDLLEVPTKRMMLTKTPSLTSCFKQRTNPSERSKSLPNHLQFHVHFSEELDSRWSNGSTKFSKPLRPMRRCSSK